MPGSRASSPCAAIRPKEQSRTSSILGDLESAAQLAQLIDRVQAERAPYTEVAIPGFPGAARVERRTKVDIAVAAFPNGHPRSRHPREHIDSLLAKEAAGATLAITQLFFHADDYLAFVQRSRQAGVTIPILPGIMPITSPARLRRVLELSGESLPSELAIALEVEPSGEGQEDVGVAYASALVRDVIAGGAPGVHLYAFNNHRHRARGPPRRRSARPRHPERGPTMTESRPAFPRGTILGYPRIGRRRELKRAVEAHWSGALDEAALEATAAELRRTTRTRLAELGLGATDSSIPESFSYYDQVLDAAVAVGALPERFAGLRAVDGSIGLDAYFTAARGEGENAPLEMTKWFDTNYHYLVPEIGPETVFALSSDRFARQVAEAKADGFTVRPVVVGPVTLLALAKSTDAAARTGFDPLSRLDDLLPVYAELLAVAARRRRRVGAAGRARAREREPAR